MRDSGYNLEPTDKTALKYHMQQLLLLLLLLSRVSRVRLCATP